MITESKPFFSIIIPTYNRADNLCRALESLSNQTFRDFEVLVCDDGSTDDTAAVVDAFRGRLRLIHLWEINWGGPARPRNRGITMARGEWVCFLDSDDWWYPQKLATVWESTDNADLIHHDCAVFGRNGKKLLPMKGRQLKPPVFADLMTGWNAIYTSTVCVRRSIFDRVGGFTEEKSLVAIEDFDLWIRIARCTDRFVHIPKVLGAYWVADGESKGNISAFSNESLYREAAIHRKYVSCLVEGDRLEAARMISYRQGIVYWHLGNFRESRRSFFGAIGAKRLRTILLTPIWIFICYVSECMSILKVRR